MRPLIGITPDTGTSVARPGRPPTPRYELKHAYADAILEAGGAPLVLPYAEADDAIERYLATIAALVVSGGAFDVPPADYGESPHPKLGPLNPARTRFERRMLEGALARGLPVLGVCGGMQLLNVVAGGSLVQDLESQLPDAHPHQQAHDPREVAHDVTIEPKTRLSRIVGGTRLGANSTHHQAVKGVGRGLVASARAADGVIEAIEGTGAAFVVGVQWHPELLADAPNRAIYEAIVEAAR